MSDFDDAWEDLTVRATELGLSPSGAHAGEWASWMRHYGYQMRLHDDSVNRKIVETLIRSAPPLHLFSSW